MINIRAVMDVELGISLNRLERDGYTILKRVFTSGQVTSILADLGAALGAVTESGGTIRIQNGDLYGSRNILGLWPASAMVWRHELLPEVLEAVLGQNSG